MRKTVVAAVALVVLAAAFAAVAAGGTHSAGGTSAGPTYPRCSAARHGFAVSPGFFRFCGPGRAVLRVQGKSFTFKRGRCTSTRAEFGRFARDPSNYPLGRGFVLVLEHRQHRSGPNPVIDGAYQLPGVDLNETPTGTAIIAKNLKSATFSVVTTGPSGPITITGSWRCGRTRFFRG